jgi:ATP-dependent exoDNAse (exonuclease V) alpha subunit
LKRTLTYLFLVLLFVSATLFTQGQNGNSYLYGVEVSGVDGSDDVKKVNALLKSLDPHMKISYSEVPGSFKLFTSQYISVQQLSDVLFNAGYHLGDVTIAISNESSAKSLPSDFPQMHDTGNKQQDKQNYQQAKAQWVLENEERYNLLNSPVVMIMSQKEFDALSAVEQERLITNGTVLIQP